MAAKIARFCHDGQVRDNNRPYITHPARVAGQVLVIPDATEEWAAAAYLHDVLEDTAMTVECLRLKFPPSVVDVVVELTNQFLDKAEKRESRKAKERERLGRVSPVAKIIKMLDREDNLLEMPIPCKFRDLYVEESKLLLPLLADANEELALRVSTVIDNVR
jgi:(p)ppGpp synthase/HD superfamily hydrolase